MFSLFFREERVTNYQEAKECNTEAFSTYFEAMLEEGIYLPPSQFESNFLSVAHKEVDLEKTIEANYKALQQVKEG
jgi:glutamate-1-semialdehyde 2,1-aminomutase